LAAVSKTHSQFAALRDVADAATVAAIERLVETGVERELARINVLAFAAARGLDEERVIETFLHAVRLGLFELSWDVLCPMCGGVLDVTTTLRRPQHAVRLRAVRKVLRALARRDGRGGVHGQPARAQDRRP
jgi:hypothetical protein